MSKALKRAAPVIGAIAGSALLPGLGTALGASISGLAGGAIGSGIGGLAAGQKPLQALAGAAGSYFGGSLAQNVLGGSLGTIGSTLGTPANAIGPDFINLGLGGATGNALGAQLANTSIASVLGSYAGNSIGSDMFASMPQEQNAGGPAPFKPSKEDEQELPSSLSSFSTLNPRQRTSNLATQGVYGSGLGPEEERYFLNQVNRDLVNDDGSTDELSSLSPIEMSYLQKLGLGNAANSNSLLEAITKWKRAA